MCVRSGTSSSEDFESIPRSHEKSPGPLAVPSASFRVVRRHARVLLNIWASWWITETRRRKMSLSQGLDILRACATPGGCQSESLPNPNKGFYRKDGFYRIDRFPFATVLFCDEEAGG